MLKLNFSFKVFDVAAASCFFIFLFCCSDRRIGKAKELKSSETRTFKVKMVNIVNNNNNNKQLVSLMVGCGKI